MDFMIVCTCIVVHLTILARGEDTHVMTASDSNILFGDFIYMEVEEPEDVAFLYKLRPAKNFGSQFDRKYHSIHLIPGEPYHGCSPLQNKYLWQDNNIMPVVMLQRGECSFVSKAHNAEVAGALAVLITDNDKNNDEIGIEMIGDDTSREIHIPAYFLLGKDGFMIKRSLEKYDMASAYINIPVNLTGVAFNSLRKQKPPWTLW